MLDMIESPLTTPLPTGPVRRVFVATHSTQGMRPDDFCSASEGEFVITPRRICTDATEGDACGCLRSTVGIGSGGKTTTMKVVVCPVDTSLIPVGIRRYLKQSDEWQQIIEHDHEDPEVYLARLVEGLLAEAAAFTIGDVVEFRNNQFSKREPSRVLLHE